ncbi:class I SAM-dependent methyltransferase [Olivibacter ginsenosidimutans]|uniref:Class I SAM-dependent methyltransferase n=1 Tax=Olivibacter ginsenosidimutans TaxID=1176537 RepID=A0ABP9CCA1_9SPHI
MEQELTQVIIEFFKNNERQGPGNEWATTHALNLVEGLDKVEQILDIGCGTGAQTITLAQKTNATIIAVDLLSSFLKVVEQRAAWWNFQDRIQVQEASMQALPFEEDTFDLIWSEGAIYHMGFENGLKQWYKLLKTDGYLVVSEISWITQERPHELVNYWVNNYPEIDLISNKMKMVEQCGYLPVGCFTLPREAWDNYYHPIIKQIAAYFGKPTTDTPTQSFLDQLIEELIMYQRYSQFYNYVFYVMKK